MGGVAGRPVSHACSAFAISRAAAGAGCEGASGVGGQQGAWAHRATTPLIGVGTSMACVSSCLGGAQPAFRAMRILWVGASHTRAFFAAAETRCNAVRSPGTLVPLVGGLAT